VAGSISDLGTASLGGAIRSPIASETARGAALTDMQAGIAGLRNDRAGLKKACKEFESFLVYQTIREMRKTVEKNPLFHGGEAEDMFEGFLDMETARKISDSGGFGLWKILYKQLEAQVPAESGQAVANAYGKQAAARDANGRTFDATL
jgi:Rod binding domain-containing protein